MFTFDISLVRYRCQHSKINSISPRDHVLFSMYSRLRFSQLHFSTSTKMRRFIGHAVAGTMFLTISVYVPFGGLLETSCKWIAAAEQFGSWFLHIGFILLEKHPRKCGALGICFFFTFTDYIYSLCIYVVALYVFVILLKRTNWTNPFWGTIRKTKRKTTKAKTRQNVG